MRTLSVTRERPVAPIALDVLALVDLAVAVDSWPEFERIKTRLVEAGAVTTDKDRPHRLSYRATAEGGRYPLDLLPFGGLEQRPSEIAWPPDLSVVMNVAGTAKHLPPLSR